MLGTLINNLIEDEKKNDVEVNNNDHTLIIKFIINIIFEFLLTSSMLIIVYYSCYRWSLHTNVIYGS